MIEQSNETIVLVDHSKFGNNGFLKYVIYVILI